MELKSNFMMKIVGKAKHLLPLWNGGERLKLFVSDLLDEGSFDAAVEDCDGVFHVAASMQFGIEAKENIGTVHL